MSAERPRLLLALVPQAEQLLEELLFGGDAAEVAASAEDAGQLEALVAEIQADGVLLSPDLPGLTADLCRRVRAGGLRLVGVALDERGERQLAAFGIERRLRPPVDADELALAHAADMDDEPVAAATGRAAPGVVDAAPLPPIIAFVGAKGAPGASACAASFAALAQRRWPTLLVELDLLGGGLDVCVSRREAAASPLALVEALQRGAEPIPELLSRALAGGERGWPPVLLAPPKPEAALPALAGPGILAGLLAAVGARTQLLVLDVGWLVSAEGGLAAEAHREALLLADRVLLVLGARDEQLGHGLAQLEWLLAELPQERLRLVVNGLGGPGAASRGELRDALAVALVECGLGIEAWLPFEPRSLARARRHGSPLALARPRAGYARGIGRLVDDLFSPARPALADRRAEPAADPPAEEVPAWR